MRVFLSSTAYDLFDLRELAIHRLQQAGHSVVYHESPDFPVRPHEHSHDQCILAVEGCDVVVCVVDGRYGGTYSGQLKDRFKDQMFRVGKLDVTVPANELSITWCEGLEARRLGIPVITFARKRVLDEKEIWKKNSHVANFKTVFVEKTRVFDMLDWTNHQKRSNWIIPFNHIVEFEQKLLAWVGAFQERTVSAARTPVAPVAALRDSATLRPTIAVLVEGMLDVAIVRQIVARLDLPATVSIIPAHGRMALLEGARGLVSGALAEFTHVILLADSDGWTSDGVEYARTQFAERMKGLPPDSVSFVQAVPSIEAWVIAGVDPATLSDMSGRQAGTRDLRQWVQDRTESGGSPNLDRIGWNLDVARAAEGGLAQFVERLQWASGKLHTA